MEVLVSVIFGSIFVQMVDVEMCPSSLFMLMVVVNSVFDNTDKFLGFNAA